MVTWRESAENGPSRAYAARLAGGSWGSPAALQASGNPVDDPMVAIDPCGNAVAIWSEFEASRKRVWANRFETTCSGGGTTRRD